MNISILNFENSPFRFQPCLVQMVFPVEVLNFLFTEGSFVKDDFFRLHLPTSRSASETNHVQGLVSGVTIRQHFRKPNSHNIIDWLFLDPQERIRYCQKPKKEAFITTAMGEPHIQYATKNSVATLTLNRPEVKNAFSHEMITLWREYLEKAKEDDDIRVIVVTGKGDTFCSGGDIKDMAEGKLKSWDMKRFLWDGVHRIVLTLEDLDKPVIAAINGAAMGAGMDMAIMCDLRVCSDRARLAESYIMMGLVPGDGGAYFLPRLVGTSKALELLLTAEVLDAEEALRLGIVNRVVAHDHLMEETMKLAEKIASKPPLAVRMIKRAVYQAQSSTLRAHLDYISSQLSLLSETQDHIEAAEAFLEKRKPHFLGK